MLLSLYNETSVFAVQRDVVAVIVIVVDDVDVSVNINVIAVVLI